MPCRLPSRWSRPTGASKRQRGLAAGAEAPAARPQGQAAPLAQAAPAIFRAAGAGHRLACLVCWAGRVAGTCSVSATAWVRGARVTSRLAEGQAALWPGMGGTVEMAAWGRRMQVGVVRVVGWEAGEGGRGWAEGPGRCREDRCRRGSPPT